MTQESNQETALQIFEETSAVRTGHFVFASGRHGATYLDKTDIYPFTSKVSHLCRLLAGSFASDQVDVVVAPAMGGVVLSQWAASHLGTAVGREVLALYAKKSPAGLLFLIKPGWHHLIAGRRILVVEDILNTGESARKIVTAVREMDGEVVGVGALWNRGGVTAQKVGDVPKLISLINLQEESWLAADCPLCAQNIPVNTDVGHGATFVASR